ncbi:MAG: molybdopterin-dependent oxidoreductase [bacterium]
MEISRREFLKYLGVASAGVTLSSLGCDTIWSVPDKIYEEVGGAPRIETWKTSVCSLCHGGCGIKVRLIDGIPVRILGNPIHPLNRGGICPMAEAGIEALFNPDRIKHPMKRVGDRGEDKWESISWEEAIELVVSHLRSLREKNETHKLAFFTGNTNNLLSSLIERFMEAFYSLNLFAFDENNFSTLTTYLTQGHKNPLAYHFKDIKLLINFGADLLDVGPSPIRFNQLYSELRNREDGQRVRIIHIDSRLSRTASNSHEWVPIKLGTMAALALGIANVVIKDGQYDKDFVKTNSFGFEDWKDRAGNFHQGFKALVEREYYPEKVAEITGVPASKIVELAREFGAEESALVLAGGQATNSSNGLYTSWAIESLNALKGNFKKDGCIFVLNDPPFAELPKVQIEGIASKEMNYPKLTELKGVFCFPEYAISYLPNRILDKQPYPIEVLFLTQVNPVFNSVKQRDFIAALKEIPFVVSFSSFLDETSAYADLILPDHTFLEKHEVIYSIPMVDFSHLGIQQPVVEPFYNTRHVGDVILQIAQNLGGTIAASLSWSDYKEYIQSRLKGIYKTGAGTIFTERMDEAWLKYLKERGWQILEYTTFEEFWDVLLDKGGWWDPFPSKLDFRKLFDTPSKKFEFYSQILIQEVKSQLPGKDASEKEINLLLGKWNIAARGDLAFLPHYESLKFNNNESKFDLHLLTYNLITNLNGVGGNLPLIQELFGLLTREYWRSWVEVNPETARKYGISDRDIVKVTSPKGSLKLKVKLLPNVMPEVVHFPFGLGHKAYGRYAEGIGENPYEILLEDYDFLSGGSSLINTKVMVEKVKGKERA